MLTAMLALMIEKGGAQTGALLLHDGNQLQVVAAGSATQVEILPPIIITIRDNGVDIAPDNLDKIFQPFFTTKPSGEGTGLGLSIAYEIISQSHSGTITVESQVGEYSLFTITLPQTTLTPEDVGYEAV